MKILVTGATGTAGSELVRQAITDNDITSITALVRRPLQMEHPKLRTIIHNDFLDYSGLAGIFAEQNACIWCLGISQNQVSKEQYHVITYDYTLSGARALIKANPSITFLYVSGEGADPSENSRILFARVKGKAENVLLKLPFQRLFIARPGGIIPIHKKPNAAFSESIMTELSRFLGIFAPRMVIKTDKLAKAMLHIIKHGYPKTIIGNRELRRIGR